MNKESQNVGEMLGNGADAFAVGAGAAAIVALIRQAAEANRQAKLEKKRESDAIDPDTIVLTVRNRKTAEDCCDGAACCQGASPKIEPAVVSSEIKPTSSQPRRTNGQYTSIDSSMSEKQALFEGPVTQAGNILAVLGGSALGYMAISKLAQRLEQNRLQRQVDAAQREYVELLKKGEAGDDSPFSRLFMIGDDSVAEFEKSAGIITDIVSGPKMVSQTTRNLTGAALASYVLAAGGAAYIVKKLLEDRFSKKEEEPERKTRILFKAGSSEFEIEPEQMLATVGIFKDCIADSLPIKTAEDGGSVSHYGEYKWLDDLSKVDGGKQFILDQYARQQGLERPESDFRIPMSILAKYGPAMAAYQRNPEAHSAAIRSHVMNMARNDPEEWFRLLGQKNNQDLVRLKADQQIRNLENGSGWKSTLASVPFIGSLFKKLLSWMANNTNFGRRQVARQSLASLGVDGSRINDIVSKYNFSPEGWSPIEQQKLASVLGDYVTWSSRIKSVKDNTNKEILAAIQRLKDEEDSKTGEKKRRKSDKNKKVVVTFSEDLNDVIPAQYRKQLAAALEASA